MIWILAKAEGPDPTDSNLSLVFIAMVTIAAVCLLAAVPVVFARRRGLGQNEGIAALMVLWGLFAAGSILWWANAQIKFSHEATMRLMQDFDPRDQAEAPDKPWMIWGFLTLVYGGALLWSSTARKAPARGFPIEPTPGQKDPLA